MKNDDSINRTRADAHKEMKQSSNAEIMMKRHRTKMNAEVANQIDTSHSQLER